MEELAFEVSSSVSANFLAAISKFNLLDREYCSICLIVLSPKPLLGLLIILS